ncbi:hypothetical protein Taro_007609 [Colocasia esculenta]|uniref:YDG domain-containing protein n=1 Tax=Colocasia esculenta TaxID=4460 RepID=A0A843U4H8_COLES|nr:hypothetical protein [Colocasia esculenta]
MHEGGNTFAHHPRFLYGFGYYAPPLQPTGFHGPASPNPGDEGTVKSSNGSQDLFNCLGGAGQAGTSKALGCHATEPQRSSHGLQQPMVPSEQLSRFLVLKPPFRSTAVTGDAPMDALACTDHLSPNPTRSLRLDSVEQITAVKTEQPLSGTASEGCPSSTLRGSSAVQRFPFRCGLLPHPVLTSRYVAEKRADKLVSVYEHTAIDRKRKGLPMSEEHPQHAAMAPLGPLDKGKAVVRCEEQEHVLPPVAVAGALAAVRCQQSSPPPQFEQCRKLIGKWKLMPEPTDPREKVMRILQCFKTLQTDPPGGKSTRPDLNLLAFLRREGMAPAPKYLGSVPGVQVGDCFRYRGELMATGLHHRPIAGIDSMESEGLLVAACIISSGVYDNFADGNGKLIYSGEGGGPDFKGNKKSPARDQKLKRGNLALKNSKNTMKPVRVVYGFMDPRPGCKPVKKYVYDGLYGVEGFWTEMGPNGNKIFKFELRRLPGQPQVGLKPAKNVRGLKGQGSRVDGSSQLQKRQSIVSAAHQFPEFVYVPCLDGKCLYTRKWVHAVKM